MPVEASCAVNAALGGWDSSLDHLHKLHLVEEFERDRGTNSVECGSRGTERPRPSSGCQFGQPETRSQSVRAGSARRRARTFYIAQSPGVPGFCGARA